MLKTFFAALFLLFSAATVVFAQNQQLANSLQAVVVTTESWDTFQGSARLFERKNVDSKWRAVGKSFPVVIGQNGLADTAEMPVNSAEKDSARTFKKEGDGRSPAGIFALTAAFGSGAKPDFAKLPYTRLIESTECVDDAKSSKYNQIVDRYKVGDFDWQSSEKMLAVGEQYDLGVEVAYNTSPVVKENGSCIFLHIWKDAASGTAGCTAMERANIEKVLSWLKPGNNPVLIQMPEKIYRSHQKSWKLPKIK